MEKQFIRILESALARFTRQGFLVGDCCKFVKGLEKQDAYKALGENVKDMIKQMVETKLFLRVTGIKNMMPAPYPGNGDTTNGMVAIDVALDHMGGRFTHYITLCPSLLEVVDVSPNIAPIPDGVRAVDKTIIKPEPFDRKSVKNGQSYIKDGNYDLPDAQSKPKFEVKSPVIDYLSGLKNY